MSMQETTVSKIRHWLDKPYPFILPRSAIIGALVVSLSPLLPGLLPHLFATIFGISLVVRAPEWFSDKIYSRRLFIFVVMIIILVTPILSAIGITP